MPVLLLLVCVALLLVRGSWDAMSKERESSERVTQLEDKVSVMEARGRELEESLLLLDTTEGLEEEIREKFDVSEEGEHVVLILEPEVDTSLTEERPPRWYNKLWNVIMGR